MIYENLRPGRNERDEVGQDVDMMEREMEAATDPVNSLPGCDSDDSTLWLSESWKYNTIKRAPDFNFLEFAAFGSKEEKVTENKNKQQTNQDKKRLRSRLPTFGRKHNKENKGKADTSCITRQDTQEWKYNKRTYKHPDGPESPASTHKTKISRPLASQTIVRGGGARSKESSPYSSDNESKASRSSRIYSKDMSRNYEEQKLACGWRDGGSSSSSVSSDTSSCVSPLISPSPSSCSYQLEHHDVVSPSASPTLSKRHSYLNGDEEVSPVRSADVPKTAQRSKNSLEKVSTIVEQEEEARGEGWVGRPSSHAHNLRKRDSGDHHASNRPTQPPDPSEQGQNTSSTRTSCHHTLQGASSQQLRPQQQTNAQGTSRKYTHPQDTEETSQDVREEPEGELWRQGQPGDTLHHNTTTTAVPYHTTTTTTTAASNHDSFWELWHPRPPSPSPSCPPHDEVNCSKVPYQYQSLPQLHAHAHLRAQTHVHPTTNQPPAPSPNTPWLPLSALGQIKQETPLRTSTCFSKEGKLSQIPDVGPKQEARSQALTVASEKETKSQSPTVDSKQKNRLQALTVGFKQETQPQAPIVCLKQEARQQALTVGHKKIQSQVAQKQEVYSQDVTNSRQQETRSSLHNTATKQGQRPQLPTVSSETETCFQILSNDFRGEETTHRNSAISPVLPPLPPELVHQPNSSLDTLHVAPSEADLDVTSVYILSLDLTVNCEELSVNGLRVESSANNKSDDLGFSESNIDYEEETLKQDETASLLDNKSHGSTEAATENTGSGPRSLSASSSSVRFDEKYYEKDNFDSPEDGTNSHISEGNMTLDSDLRTILECQPDDTLCKKLITATPTINEDDENDFIEIDCDVKPMETLKRPLVYGYGSSPVRSLRGPTFLEKRLSQASDVSDYLEIDLLESLLNREVRNEGSHYNESCMDFKETYWDHWQAKNEAEERLINKSRMTDNPVNNHHSRLPNCPSSRFCYDPEVLLAQVRCPKSLEDATFKQYSAYVKSHIYDHFGNIQESLKKYGLPYRRSDWISSQPEFPDFPRNCHDHDTLPLDYSSEPELSNSVKKRQPWAESAQSNPQHSPSLRPAPLSSRDASMDSGTWTYTNSEESTVVPSPLSRHMPPLPRSTSSLSHVGPGVFNPWHHLLPDVTPPRTPRHSMYYTSSSPCESRPGSPTPSRCSNTSRKSVCEPIAPHDLKWESAPRPDLKWKPSPAPAPPQTPSKKSFLPNFSAVMRSPLRKHNMKIKNTKEEGMRRAGEPVQVNTDTAQLTTRPRDKSSPHTFIQNRRLTGLSSKSSSSSSSSSSASSKDSVTTVISAPPRSKGPNWLMKHFGSNKNRNSAAV
ncbi:hypothetical protein OTU49_003670 [Cherax quadricarinatus]|uniref:Uncharacterized protein n=1 Tax=Cherax quadricarinatus TaxID=27406 RepID=A0AAW0XGA8_CHEQU